MRIHFWLSGFQHREQGWLEGGGWCEWVLSEEEEGEWKQGGHIYTYALCPIVLWACDWWSSCPIQSLPEGDLTGSHGRTFSTSCGLIIGVWHLLHIHILPRKPLKGISLAQLVPTGRPPTIRIILPRVPKTTPGSTTVNPLVRAPGYVDSSWLCNSATAFQILYSDDLILRSPSSVPHQSVCPFCVPPCQTNTKSEQPGTLTPHGILVGTGRWK